MHREKSLDSAKAEYIDLSNLIITKKMEIDVLEKALFSLKDKINKQAEEYEEKWKNIK